MLPVQRYGGLRVLRLVRTVRRRIRVRMNTRFFAYRCFPALTRTTAIAAVVLPFCLTCPSEGNATGEQDEPGQAIKAQGSRDGDHRAVEETDGEGIEQVHGKTGEDIASQCNTCHGEGGHSTTPEIPSIGGFSAFAIVDLLDTYRMGLRTPTTVDLPDGTETDMEQVVHALSEDDQWAVAEYYSMQPWRPREQNFDADLAARGARIHDEKCDKCHHDGGRDPEFDLPITAGQWREYLVAEFENFDSGRRALSTKMKEKYDTLSASGKRAIIELYVSAGKY